MARTDDDVAAAGSTAAQRTNRFAGGDTQDRSAGICKCHGAIIGQGCSAADSQVASTDRGASGVSIRATQDLGATAGFNEIAGAGNAAAVGSGCASVDGERVVVQIYCGATCATEGSDRLAGAEGVIECGIEEKIEFLH